MYIHVIIYTRSLCMALFLLALWLTIVSLDKNFKKGVGIDLSLLWAIGWENTKDFGTR